MSIGDLYRTGMATMDRIDHARTTARAAGYEARALAVGARGLHRETMSARYADRTVVGASILQTPGGVQSEMDRINADMMIFSKEISDEIERRGYPDKQDAVTAFYASVWSPFIREWQSFYAANRSWWGNLWWNHAPEAETYRDQLVQLRTQARELGMTVTSPDPAAPTPGWIESVLGAIWGLLKTLVYAGTVIAAIWTLRALYLDLRAR